MLNIILVFMLLALRPPPEPIEMPACVQFKGYTWLANGDIGLSFYNLCGTAMRMKVCVTDYFGKKRLYFSKDPIPHRGWYRVYLDNNQLPRDYAFTYDSETPKTPPSCAS